MQLFSLPLHSRDPQERSVNIAFFLLLLAVGLTYMNGLDAKWILDDYGRFVRDSSVHITSLSWDQLLGTLQDNTNLRRPLSTFSFALNHLFFGIDSWWFHALSILSHLFVSIALYHLFLRVLRLPLMKDRFQDHAPWVALLGATLWAVHPLQVMGVTYACQRMTSLCALFCVLSISQYIEARMATELSDRIARFLTCGVFALLGLGFKENAALIPLFLLIVEVVFIRGGLGKAFLKHLPLLFVLLGLGVLFVHLLRPAGWDMLAEYDNRSFSLLERILAEPRILVFYLSLVFFPAPWRFSVQHDVPLTISLFSPWQAWAAPLLLLILFIAALVLYRKYPFLSAALLFFFVGHSLESSIIPLELIFEHRNYLPSMFLFLGVAVFLHGLFRRLPSPDQALRALGIAGLCLVLGLGWITHGRNQLFGNQLALWAQALDGAPEVKRINLRMGLMLDSIGRTEQAAIFFQRAIDLGRPEGWDRATEPYLHQAAFLKKHQLDPGKVLGNLYVVDLMDPGNISNQIMLATNALTLNRPDLALYHVRKAIPHLEGQHYGLQFLTARIFLLLHRPDLAMPYARRAMEIWPDNPWIFQVLGEIVRIDGNPQKSILLYQRSLEFQPDSLQALAGLMLAARDAGDQTLLSRTRSRLLSLAPGLPSAARLWDSFNTSSEGLLLAASPDELQALLAVQ